MQTLGTTAKDFSCFKKTKTKDSKSALPYDNTAELAEKKDKQKKFQYRHKHIRVPKETLAIGNNTVNITKKKKKRDTSKDTYFNYNKKSYYASNCTKLKNEYRSWQPPYRWLIVVKKLLGYLAYIIQSDSKKNR